MVIKKKPLKAKETKPSFSRSQKPLNQEETLETNETQFWKEVEARSKDLIATLIEKTLPISATPQNFNLEKDVDYRVLLRDDLPNFYQDNEEYLAKIAQGNWTEEDVEYVSQDLTCQYFEIVVSSLVDHLSNYANFSATSLTNLGGI